MRSTLRTLLLLALATPAIGAELNRAEVVARAGLENPQIVAARAAVSEVRAQGEQADAARWPLVTIQAGTGPSIEADLVPGTAAESTKSITEIGLDDVTIGVGAQLSVIQPLYTFGKIDDRRAAARHGVAARTAEAEMTRSQVAFEAAKLYEAWLLSRDSERFLDEVRHITERSLEYAEREVGLEGAAVTESDVLQLRAGLRIVQIGLSQARAGRAQTEAGLRAYLGLPETEPLVAGDESLAPLALAETPAETLVKTALERRPEMTALREGQAAFEKLADAEEAGYLPDIFMLAAVSAAYTPNRDRVQSLYVVDPLYHLVPSLLLGVRWTIQGDMAGARADEVRARARRLEGMMQWARQGVPAEVRKAYEDAQRARRDLDSAAAGVVAAKQWTVRTNLDFTAGMGTAAPIADAVTAYSTLRLAQLDGAFRLNVALADLARATGTLGSPNGPYPGAPTQPERAPGGTP